MSREQAFVFTIAYETVWNRRCYSPMFLTLPLLDRSILIDMRESPLNPNKLAKLQALLFEARRGGGGEEPRLS